MRFELNRRGFLAAAGLAGFGALASSAVPTARDMGIFEALGVLALLVLTVAFIPAALSLLPRDALGKTGADRCGLNGDFNRTGFCRTIQCCSTAGFVKAALHG